eukprot:1339550-Amorphochlora_amoeboformis.AAC.1
MEHAERSRRWWIPLEILRDSSNPFIPSLSDTAEVRLDDSHGKMGGVPGREAKVRESLQSYKYISPPLSLLETVYLDAFWEQLFTSDGRPNPVWGRCIACGFAVVGSLVFA